MIVCKKFDAVLFDFDGTVADTGRGIFTCLRQTLAEMGIKEIPLEKLERFIGPPLHHSFQTEFGFDEAAAAAAVERYREKYRGGGLFDLDLYDGIVELLEKLKQAGVKTGLASAKPEQFIYQILEKYSLGHLFDAVSGSSIDNIHAEKVDIIRRTMEALGLVPGARVLMVGDRLFDILGAKDAGIQSAGVLFGYGSREELEKAGADYIVKSPAELLEIVTG